jgi:hypothetical protein
MEQNIEQYWPQHKVFFIATLVLFPDKLNGHEVNPWFYQPYFVGKGLDIIEIELEDYQNAGYLKYVKTHGLYTISEINAQKVTDDLIRYLKKWQCNELLSLPAGKPPDPARQRELLLNAITRAYANNKDEPRITLEDVYGKPLSYAYEPPFWELVLSYQLLDKKVKIKYMDYDRRTDGLYDDDTQPLVDLKIVDKELGGFVKVRVAQKPKPIPPTMSANIIVERPESKPAPTTREATVFMRERLVCITISGDKTYPIAQLEETGPYHMFMNHLTASGNSNIDITIDEVKKIKGLQSTKTLTELVRYCGFSRQLKKKAFFPTCKKDRIRFKPVTLLDDKQVEVVINQATKLEAKNRKQIGNKS